MRGMISSGFILLLGSVLTSAEDAGISVTGLPTPLWAALQQRDVNTNWLDLSAKMLTDDQDQENLVSSDSFKADSGQTNTQFRDDDLPQMGTQLAQRELKRQARNRKFYIPKCFFKTSAPLLLGKKSAPNFVGKKSAPHVVSNGASPYFVGKKSAQYLAYKLGTPYLVGEKSVPMFVRKIAVSMVVDKKAVPLFVADILDNQSGSNMQEVSVDPIPPKEDSYFAIPVNWLSRYSSDVLKRNVYPAPYFVGKRYNIPVSFGQ